jgi:tetratricopeptide (TPR) repeat protein
MTMATARTDQDNLSGKSIQGTVVVSGQITPELGLRSVLEELLEDCRHIQHGVLRVLSKDVRGHIGIFCGSYIAGAHVTTSREYGVQALKQLLGASRGMYAFLSLTEQQIELKQSLSLSIDELLNWQPANGTDTVEISHLADAVEQLVSHSGRFEAISDTELGELQNDLLGPKKEIEPESSFLAWGGDMPVLASNLSRLKLAPRKVDTQEWSPLVEIERIPMPDDFDELEAATTAANKQHQDDQIHLPARTAGTEAAFDSLDDEAHRDGWSASDLDAIPTPNRKAAANQQQTNQVDADIQRSLRDHRNSLFGNINRSLEQPARHPQNGLGETEGAPSLGRSSQRNRVQTQDDIALSSLLSQRMQAVDPKAFISESTARSAISTENLRRSGNSGRVWLVAGSAIGVAIAVLMAQQVIQINAAGSHLQSGLDALKSNSDKRAVLEFSEVIKNQPDSVKGYFYRACAEAKLDQSKKAVADFSKAISLDPKYVLAYAGRAGARLSLKEYDGTLADCEELHKLKQDYMDQYRMRAIALVNKNEYKDAIEDASFYIDATDGHEQASGRSDIFATRAFAYYKLKNYDKAIKDYTEAILLNPKNPAFYESRAMVYRDMHNWRRALTDANKAAHLDPSDINVFQLRGSCYIGQGDTTRALAEFDKALKMKPSANTHRWRGQARLATANYQGALDDFEYSLNANPYDPETEKLADQARAKIRGAAKPVAAINTSAADESVNLKGNPTELLNKGYKLLKEGSSSEAAEYLAASVKGNPNNIDARRYLAYALLDSGDAAGAIQQFSAVSSIGSLQTPDKVALSKALVSAHKLETAISLLQSVISTEPTNDAARIALINAYLAAGFKDKAAGLAREGASRSPGQREKYSELLEQAR